MVSLSMLLCFAFVICETLYIPWTHNDGSSRALTLNYPFFPSPHNTRESLSNNEFDPSNFLTKIFWTNLSHVSNMTIRALASKFDINKNDDIKTCWSTIVQTVWMYTRLSDWWGPLLDSMALDSWSISASVQYFCFPEEVRLLVG